MSNEHNRKSAKTLLASKEINLKIHEFYLSGCNVKSFTIIINLNIINQAKREYKLRSIMTIQFMILI